MTDKELFYIKTIAEEGNISKAAQKLHIAQPALSQCVRRLEEQLEFLLFTRSKNGVALTEAGKAVYDAACVMLRTWEGALERLRQLRKEAAGTLTIGASWYATTLLLTGAVTEFSRARPGVEVRLIEKNTATLLPMLRSGELNAAVIHEYPQGHPLRADERGLRSISLFTERFCVICHKRFDLDSRARLLENGEKELDLVELSGVPVVEFSRGQRVRHIADYAFELAKVAPRASLSTYGFPSVVDMVRHGAGAALLPELYARRTCAQPSYKDLRLYRIPEAYRAFWTTAVCCLDTGQRSPLLDAFIAILKEEASRLESPL